MQDNILIPLKRFPDLMSTAVIYIFILCRIIRVYISKWYFILNVVVDYLAISAKFTQDCLQSLPLWLISD